MSNSSSNIIYFIVTTIGVSEGLLQDHKESYVLDENNGSDSRPSDVSELAVSLKNNQTNACLIQSATIRVQF